VFNIKIRSLYSMGKNGQYVFSRRLGEPRFLGGIFGAEKTLFFSQKSEESSVFRAVS
jgi:hypothetical protein